MIAALVFAGSASAATWQPAQNLATPVQGATAPAVALAGNGDGFAAWIVDTGTSEFIQAATRGAGAATWDSPTDLTAPGDVADLDVGADGSGGAVAAWRAVGGSVRVRRYVPGSGWQAVDEIANSSGASSLSLAVGSGGAASVAFAKTGGGAFAAYRPPGGPWESADEISDTGETATSVSTAVDAGDGAWAAWQRTSAGLGLFASRHPASGGWSAAQTVDGSGVLPRVHAASDGTGYIVWADSGVFGIASSPPATPSWTEQSNPNPAPGSGHLLESLDSALDPAGGLLLVVADRDTNGTVDPSDDTLTSLGVQYRSPGGTWDTSNELTPSSSRVAAAGTGRFFVVYEEPVTSGVSIRSRVYEGATSGLDGEATLAADEAATGNLAVAGDPDGHGLAGWLTTGAFPQAARTRPPAEPGGGGSAPPAVTPSLTGPSLTGQRAAALKRCTKKYKKALKNKRKHDALTKLVKQRLKKKFKKCKRSANQLPV